MASSRSAGVTGIRVEPELAPQAHANHRAPTSVSAGAVVDLRDTANARSTSNGSSCQAVTEPAAVNRNGNGAAASPQQQPLRVHELSKSQLNQLLVSSPGRSASYALIKRVVDVTVAGILVVVTAPLMVLIALLIRLDSPGPALFRQARLGRDLNQFEFIKFRTMYVDARERFPEMYAYQFDDQDARYHQFKTAHDPRLTRVGRWIRRTSLDELPNFISVLRGDMSMVGPRPEIPEMLPYYRPEEICKFSVLPGVSGLAQVSGRNMLIWAQTNALDVEYVHRRSFRLDLTIMVRTVTAVVGMVGAL